MRSASADYDAIRCRRIGTVDPGAVPGRSTRIRKKAHSGGPETGSTRAVKAVDGVRDGSGVTGPGITNANDNFVVANDNSREVAIAA
jgi:hypothetical protein